jgi:uncharacterized protein (TIGR02444 family)
VTAAARTGEALWPYALDIYGRPGVEALLLELQDAHGQCIPYLLWALWLASRGRPADAAALAAGAGLARAWQAAAILPLRDLRRGLGSGALQPQRERLRTGVKSLELEAERMLLQMLEDASPVDAGEAQLGAGLAAAAGAWGGEAPAALLQRLATLAA